MSKSARGFTLLEVLVAIALIAILTTIVSSIFSGVRARAEDARRRSDVAAIAKAYEAHFNPASGQYPTTLLNEWFASGIIPTPPEGGSYFRALGVGNTGFRVCGSLGGGPLCSIPDPNTCYCIDSQQGVYIASGYTTPYSYPTPAYAYPTPAYGYPTPAYGYPTPAYAYPTPAYGYPTPVPPPTTVDFNIPAGSLDGQYPAGVIDWGNGFWSVVEFFPPLTSNTIKFSADVASRTFTFMTPKTLISIKAYNDSASSATVTLSCTGQSDKITTIPVGGSLVTITTGWTGTCTTVTVTSSNNWNMLFDDLVYQ